MLTLLPAAVGLAVAGHARAAWLAGAAGLAASVFHLGQPRRAWRIFLGWRSSWLSREAMVFGGWFALLTGALLEPRLLPASALVGFLGLVCSAMIYVDTRRRLWRASQTFPRLLGTAAVVALAFASAPLAGLALLLKLAVEWRTFFDGSPSARLQRGPLAPAGLVRDVCGLSAAVLLIAGAPLAALAPLLAGELAERYLFFRAVDAPKMPGVPA